MIMVNAMMPPVAPDRIRLNLKSGFYDPFWYNRCQGREFVVNVANGEVIVEGETFSFGDSFDQALLPNKVFVYVGRNITCVDFDTQTHYQEKQKEYTAALETQKQNELNRRRNKLREDADAFNRAIKLPVPWSIGFKDVLSGLSERSNGCGTNKSTVYHVVLHEALDSGRLKRTPFSFLCTAPSGNDGKDWGGCNADPIHHYDGEGNTYKPKPTCKACLKLLERFSSDE